MSTRVNCNAKFRFQVKIRTPNASGVLATPAAGAVTGILLRLASARNGTAIHADVNNLAATEASGQAGTFYVEVSQTLLQTHVLPLGVGKPFWAIWYRTNEFNMENTRFIVDDGTDN